MNSSATGWMVSFTTIFSTSARAGSEITPKARRTTMAIFENPWNRIVVPQCCRGMAAAMSCFSATAAALAGSSARARSKFCCAAPGLFSAKSSRASTKYASARRQAQRSLRLFACPGGALVGFHHACQPGMRAGVVRVQGNCFPKFFLSFARQPLLREFAPTLDVKGDVAGGVCLRQPRFVVVLNLQGELAEGGLVVVALDSLRWEFGRSLCTGASRNRVEKTLGFSVRMEGQEDAEFARGVLRLAFAREHHSQVEMIVRIAGIVLHALFKVIASAFVAEPGGNHA